MLSTTAETMPTAPLIRRSAYVCMACNALSGQGASMPPHPRLELTRRPAPSLGVAMPEVFFRCRSCEASLRWAGRAHLEPGWTLLPGSGDSNID
jgi:hypothetical protein